MESVYETINDVMERSRLPVSCGPEMVDAVEHVYDNIDDFLVESVPAEAADIHQIPPPLPPPPLPARRPTVADEVPLCRSEVLELDSHHVYTIADVLDSFEALAAHLPRAQRFIFDLQTAAYLDGRRSVTDQAEPGRRTDAETRWTAAAAVSRGKIILLKCNNGSLKLKLKLNKTLDENSSLCSIWDHTHTCHPTSERAPALTPASKLVLDLPTPEGWKAELT